MTGAEIIERCRALARFSETPDCLTRTFLCPAMHDVHRTLRAWMEEAGMDVGIDSAANLHAFYAAATPDAPRLLIGSHVDTVPNAGAFDGVLGVVLAIALVGQLAGRRLPFAIEVVAFSEEEGVRFGVPFIGSRALVGALDEALLARVDAQGISVEQAIREFENRSLTVAARIDLPSSEPRPSGSGCLAHTLGYLEFHIEQGPVLDTLNLPLGIVTAIVGQTRCEVTFQGEANHAGATPMHLRRDALTAAARWIALVEQTARATPGMVATVGALHVHPGAANVIPGEVRATLDVRHADDAIRRGATAQLRSAACTWKQLIDQPAVACDARLTALLERAVEATGNPVHRMTSGAGHDAMILAAIAPIAMLFVRSPGGISHHPAESVCAADVDAALAAGLAFLAELERTHV